MELESAKEDERNRSGSAARRQNEGLPGFRYLFFGRRKEIRRSEEVSLVRPYATNGIFIGHYK